MNSTLSTPFKLTSLALCVALTACGGGGSSSNDAPIEPATTPTPTTPTPTPTPTAPTQGAIVGPHSTGSVSEPAFVYYDLDNNTVVTLTSEQAETNTAWDIAFKRTGVYLNQHSDNAVTAFATGNNSDFFDAEGTPIAASFTAATAETELTDYLAVKVSDIPTEEEKFVGDIAARIIDGFYHYDFTTHVVTPAETNYFIVNSDGAFTKFRATAITTAGRGIGQITLETAYQGSTDIAFAEKKELVIDAALTCSGDVTHVYVDFDTNQEVTISDAWDINFPCAQDKTSADFTINIAEDGTAKQDFANEISAIDVASVGFDTSFKANEYVTKAFDSTPWYQYGVNGGHLLWSQFDIYLVKTATKTHKLQITSYYNAEGNSGNISFRADEVAELAGVSQ